MWTVTEDYTTQTFLKRKALFISYLTSYFNQQFLIYVDESRKWDWCIFTVAMSNVVNKIWKYYLKFTIIFFKVIFTLNAATNTNTAQVSSWYFFFNRVLSAYLNAIVVNMVILYLWDKVNFIQGVPKIQNKNTVVLCLT